MAECSLTLDRLRELLHYDPQTGLFTWRVERKGTRGRGSIAGKYIGRDGEYRAVTIDGVAYLAHRLAWFYVYEKWPTGMIDHCNRVKTDNAIRNLREATHSINSLNRVAADSDSRLGVLGVRKRGRRYSAVVTARGRTVAVGSFATAELAHAAYQAMKRQLVPELSI